MSLELNQERVRPDLDIIFADGRLLVDVTVVNPASPSRTSRVQLATAKTAEARKLARYGDLARAHESKFLAFAVECFGGWGSEAVQVIELLKKKLAQLPPTVSSPSGEDVVRALAVSLQRGNYHVMNAGALATRASQLLPV